MHAKFRDMAGRVHEIDPEFIALLPAGCVEISDAEAAALLNPPKTQAEITAETNAAALAELAALDLASIRAIREYIAAKPDAPKILKDRETAAQLARARLKP